MKWIARLLLPVLGGLSVFAVEPPDAINRIRIYVPAGQTNRCERYANLLSSHVAQRGIGVQVTVETQYTAVVPSENELVLYPGVADADPESQSVFQQAFGSLPDENDPGAEGFSLKLVAEGSGYKAWVAGVDERGVLYGLGRLFHLSNKKGTLLAWPAPLNEKSAPHHGVRGMGISEKYAMDPAAAALTGARAWTRDEGIFQWEEHLLFGANTFTHGRGRIPPINLDLYESSGGTSGISLDRDKLCVENGVNYYGPQAANGIGELNMEEGWNATTFVGTLDPHLGCPSVPAARAMMIDLWEIYAKEAVKLEYVNLKSGDPGGCHSAACQSNWPAIFYDLCCDITDAIHVWKPDAKVYFTNQEMDADDNEALFSLLQADTGSPLAGYSYATGGSENSTYGYNLINPIWEQMYPEIDPDSTFLYSRLSYLQPDQDILSMPDVTHWKRAGSNVPYPDPVWTETFARRTYNARPTAYENVFREQMPYCSGMIGYSEGLFDDFNKYLMLRLLWKPDLTATNIALEYYTYHCGAEAAPVLTEAVFLGERILEQPFSTSREQEIHQLNGLVWQAEALMPTEYREGNWRYAEMKEWALVLQYVSQRYSELETRNNEAMAVLQDGVDNQTPASAIDEALDILDLSDMASNAPSGLVFALVAQSAGSAPDLSLGRLFATAETLDDETDAEIAIRELALTQIENMDEVGVRWLADQIAAIQAEETDEYDMVDRLREVLGYDQVGPGEFYDNCGTIDGQPHFDFSSGEFYYGSGGWPEETRPSQRWYNYSFEAQPGLEFSYEGLDPHAAYEVTVTWPNPGQLSFSMNSPNEFTIYSDDELVGQVLPPSEVAQFTFDIPLSATSDGAVRIKLRKVPGNARCTCISEIWLRKKQTMGLVAQWDFHDGTYADQVGSLDGTAHGSVSIVASGCAEFAQAAQFGSATGTDYLEMGDLSTLGIYTKSFTVSFWMKHAALPSDGTHSPEIWDSKSGNSAVGYNGIQTNIRQGNDGGNAAKIFAVVGGANQLDMELLKGDPRVDDGDWHWIVVRYDGGSDELIYLQDGVHIVAEDAVRVCSLNQWPSGKQLRIGDGFGGLIGDVRIYDAALSFEELDELY